MNPTVTYFLDTRTPVKSQQNKFPFKIRVSANRQNNRAYGADLYFTQDEYNKLIANPRKEPWKDIWIKINSKILKAEKVINELNPFFTFEEFKERFYDQKNLEVTVDTSSINYITNIVCNNYIKNGQYPMTIKIKDSVRSILKFSKTENLPMRAITPKFCREYEEYMFLKSKKHTRNGAGINLRHVRILFNQAIEESIIPRSWYPFKRESGEKSEFKDAYVIPNERKTKDYLKAEEVVAFSQVTEFNTKAQMKAHYAWLISFYCNGANAADFLRFKFKHISGDWIIFYREKIKNATRKDMKPIRIYLSPELQKLIDQVGNQVAPDNYIFPCYNEGMSEDEMYFARKQFNSNCSKSMKYVATQLGINKNIRLGNARHSLANILKKNKVDREIVKDLFGHTSITTLDNYYGSFDDDDQKELAQNFISIGSLKDAIETKLKNSKKAQEEDL